MSRLKEERIKKGDTQSTVAKAIGTSQSNYAKYERGEQEPKRETWEKLGKYFNVSVAYIMGLSNNEDIYRDDEKIHDQMEVDGELVTGSFSESRATEILTVAQYANFLWFMKENNIAISDKDVNLIIQLLNRLDINNGVGKLNTGDPTVFNNLLESGDYELLKIIVKSPENADLGYFKEMIKEGIKNGRKNSHTE